METVLPGAGAILIAIAAITATGTSTVGCLLGSSRMLFAAAREKAVPSILGKVNPRTHIPVYATVFTGIIALGATLMSAMGYRKAISIAVGAAVFSNWLMMALMNVAVIVVRIKQSHIKAGFRFPFNIKNIPVLAIVAGIASIWILTYIQTIPLLIGISWLVIITAWYFLYSRSRWEYLDEEEMEKLTK
jgi:APA family basic amino acid/polyamine antiporter